MKVGIITFYYNVINYGANLQAFALCKAISSCLNEEDSVEQISYLRLPVARNIRNYSVLQLIKKMPHFLAGKIKERFIAASKRRISAQHSIRKRAVFDFSKELIPHSRVFDDNNINETLDMYDVFVTGSDQVWNPLFYNDVYRLEFVPSDKRKISYAPSISQLVLTNEQRAMFKRFLNGYSAISVREERSVELLSDLTDMPVEYVVDPTMLLSKNEWDEVCSSRIVNEPYVFCYFLGKDSNARRVAEQFAKNKNLKIVNLPHVLGAYRKCDKNFGDYNLYDVSPADFISLIKYSEYIFTDSFHATVFSGIYEKQYFIFERKEFEGMASRIQSLVDLYESKSHFCDTREKATLEYVESLGKIDYSRPLEKFETIRSKSKQFLSNGLRGFK